MRQPPIYPIGLASICLVAGASSSVAATATGTFGVQMQIVGGCIITSTPTLDFGSQSALTTQVDHSSTLQIQCTSGTPYNIKLNAGTAAGATVTTRKLTNGSNTINYFLYRDSARTQNWGSTISSDTVSSTGTGSAQSFTVYGRVPTQTTPPPGTYTDTVTVEVEY